MAPKFTDQEGKVFPVMGYVTVIALYSASWGMCQTQVGLLEVLREKLASENLGVKFVAVNQDTWQDRFHLGQFKERAGNLQVTQDENVNMNIWNNYAAEKDDIYVVDKQGKITFFFGLPNSDLRKGDQVESAIRQTLNQSPPTCTTN